LGCGITELAILAELAVLVLGGFLYLRAGRPRSRGFAVATTAFGAALVVLTVATPFMPDPPSAPGFAVQALASYIALAVIAALVDRGREPREASR
jgi:hypothetical protein